MSPEKAAGEVWGQLLEVGALRHTFGSGAMLGLGLDIT